MHVHAHAWTTLLVGLTIASLSAEASAASPSLSIEPVFPQVTGGEVVETCGWPDTVAVTGGGGLCTGSLVHPQVVVYAAHCGGGSKQIRFSESSTSGHARSTQLCMTYPDYLGTNDQAHDWAFCVLNEPITEIPFTPPLFGCELEAIAPGLPVVIAGFGDGGPDGAPGTKRWGMTEVVNTFGNTANIGGAGLSTCQGDSGGSSFVAMNDGSWRAMSMTSTGIGGCTGTTGVHALMHPAIPWIEENAGIDITPCHDLDGTWNPTPNCDKFFAGGSQGHGTWSDWCTGTPRSGPSTSCGAAFDARADGDPPVVTITSPLHGAELPTGSLVTLAIDAQDEGWGVREVWVSIGGQEQPVRDGYPPYVFADVPFPDGVFEIVAHAEDWAGHVGVSAPVTIGINAEVPPEPTGEDTTGADDTGGHEDPSTSGTSGGQAHDSTGGAAGNDAGDGGCGCRSAPAPSASASVMLLLLALRRRRRSASYA